MICVILPTFCVAVDMFDLPFVCFGSSLFLSPSPSLSLRAERLNEESLVSLGLASYLAHGEERTTDTLALERFHASDNFHDLAGDLTLASAVVCH